MAPTAPLTRPDVVAYFGFKLGSAVVCLIPYRVGYYLALGIGELSYWLQSRRRANASANLRRVLGPELPQARLQWIVRGVFRNSAIHYFELATPAQARAWRRSSSACGCTASSISSGREKPAKARSW